MLPSTLLDQYQAAKEAYYNSDTPLMSDAAFDALEQQLIATGELDKLSVGAPERAGKVALPTPMGSLDQLRTSAEIGRWIGKYPTTTTASISEKIDGNSLLLQYKNGLLVASYSRGDGLRGANNLRHTQFIETTPKRLTKQYTGTIRGEIVVPRANWPQLKLNAELSGKVYANSRNFVAGFMNASESDRELYKYLTFVAYQVTPHNAPPVEKSYQFELLKELNFMIPEVVQMKLGHITEATLIQLTQNMIAQSAYELDGCVIEINDPAYHDTLVNLDDLNPSHGRKFKLLAEAASSITTVTQIEWNVSKHGLLKPLVHFDVIHLDGANITKATGHNARWIKDQGIGVGSQIRVERSGAVIPKITECITRVPFVFPPNSMWVSSSEVDLTSSVTASGGDTGVAIEQLTYFFQKLEILGASTGAASRLTEGSDPVIRTFIDALTCSKDVYTSRIGNSNGAKIYKALHATMKSVDFAKFAAASCCFDRGIGERKLNDVMSQLKLSNPLDMLDTPIEQILECEGIQLTSGTKIVTGMAKLRAALEELSVAGYSIKFKTLSKVKSVSNTTGKLAGQVLCATGVRFTPDVTAKIIAQGGTIADSFSSSVTILVAKDLDSTSSKIEKARAKGVQIFALDQFVESLGK